MILVVLFILGLFVGSFLNVVIDRLPRGETFLTGRSHCEACQHPLAWNDLIPLFSFISLKGKCRYCKIHLSLQYPLLEVVTGITFAIAHLVNGSGTLIDLIFLLFISSFLIIIFYIDLFSGIIPFAVVIPATIFTIVYLFFTTIVSVLFIHLLTAFAVMGFFLFLFLVTRGKGMGFGDVVYAFFMGLLLGFPNSILGLYIAFLTGAVVSLILIIQKRKRLRGSTIPFGPFLVLGTYIALLWGDTIVNYLLRTIL